MKQLTDHWNEKSEKETIQKQHDLDKLKLNRAKDLEKYQSLAKTVRLLRVFSYLSFNHLNRKLFGILV